jgi:hypothetical protein
MIAVSGAPIKIASGSRDAPPRISAPADDAAIPAIKRSESPGKARPINKPVSAKIIARIPTRPKSPTMECASKRLAAMFM